jgi:hypothetical protein
MRTTTITATAVTILLGAAIALAAPAAANQANAPTGRVNHDQISLRRDGDRAVPFDPVVGPGGKLVLRRVGSKAEPFVAEIGTQAGPSNSGFDRSEALIAGGGALGLILLGAGILLLVGRGRSGRQSQIPHGSAPARPQPH